MTEPVGHTSLKPSLILEQARLIAQQADVPEQTVLKKVNSLMRWLVISLSGSALTLLLIKLDLFQGRGPRALVALVLLMCAAGAVASAVGLLMLRGTAYALYYVRGLEERVSGLAAASSEASVERRSHFWLNAGFGIIPTLIVVNFFMVFGHNMLPTAARGLYLLGVLFVLLGLYTGVLFYKSNRNPRWAGKYDRGFRPTILFGDDRAGVAFSGLMTASMVAAVGLFGLHKMDSANAVKLKYSKKYLEDVALRSIKEKEIYGKFYVPPEKSVKEEPFTLTTTKTEGNNVRYELKPKGTEVKFIAEVTAEAGTLSTSALEPGKELDIREKRFVIGTVQIVDKDKDRFFLEPDSKASGVARGWVWATELPAEPRAGTRVVVALDPGPEPNTYEATKIEEIITAGGGLREPSTQHSARAGDAYGVAGSVALRRAGPRSVLDLRPTPSQISFNKGKQ